MWFILTVDIIHAQICTFIYFEFCSKFMRIFILIYEKKLIIFYQVGII